MKRTVVIASIIVGIVFLAILLWPKKTEKEKAKDIQENSQELTSDSLPSGQ